MPYIRYHAKRAVRSFRSVSMIAKTLNISPRRMYEMIVIQVQLQERDMLVRDLVAQLNEVTRALAEEICAPSSPLDVSLSSDSDHVSVPPCGIVARYTGERPVESGMSRYKSKTKK